MSASLAFLDVAYREDHAFAACLLADAWDAAGSRRELVVRVDDVAPYEPGSFFKRELPCLLEVLAAANEPISCAVIDGYVWLDGAGRLGLGAHLHAALGGATPVVGVAKTRFGDGCFADPVRRGSSANPLWVTAAGMASSAAAVYIRAMHGPYRVPTLLNRVDRLCRDAR